MPRRSGSCSALHVQLGGTRHAEATSLAVCVVAATTLYVFPVPCADDCASRARTMSIMLRVGKEAHPTNVWMPYVSSPPSGIDTGRRRTMGRLVVCISNASCIKTRH